MEYWRSSRGLLLPGRAPRIRGLCSSFAATHLVGFGAGGDAGIGGNDSFTKLLLHCDGADASTSFSDVSVGGAHGAATVGGNAQVDTGQSKFGGASYQGDGTGDYLSWANNADWNLGGAGGGNDFTIDFWVRFNSASTDECLIGPGNLAGTGWNLYVSNVNDIRLYNGTASTIAWTRSTGTWYHIAVVRNGTTVTWYRDGTSVGTFSDLDLNNDGLAMRIGADTGGSFSLNGWMDEIRISKGIARWTANFTPPTQAYS